MSPKSLEPHYPLQKGGDYPPTNRRRVPHHVGTPPLQLVDGLFPDNSLILVTGKPKHLKTFVVLDVAESVCLGEKVFGQHTVNRPGPVVYLGMEDGPYEIGQSTAPARTPGRRGHTVPPLHKEDHPIRSKND